jgi:hypothetical protein
MTTYYISKNGSDSNNGLGPDASHATNKPWLTIGKALGASGIASGDTVYIAPGIYREVNTIAMTSPTVETKVIGDYTNAQGFKDSSGVLIAAGEIVNSNYIQANAPEFAGPNAAGPINLNGRDFLTFENIIFFAGSSNCIVSTTTHARNITIRKCTLIECSNVAAISHTVAADEASTWIIEKSIIVVQAGNSAITITFTTSSSADYDANIIIRDCLIVGQNGVNVTATGAASFKGGGVYIRGCTIIASSSGVVTGSANVSTTFPVAVRNCRVQSFSIGVNANTSGQITEDWNQLACPSPRTNVTAGVNSMISNTQASFMEWGQSRLYGFLARAPFTLVSGMIGNMFGNEVATASDTDLFNRPNPAGGGKVSSIATDSGTATAGAASTLTDSGKSWTVNAFSEMVVEITGGTGSGQFRTITTNTATVLTVLPAWSTNPASGSTYSIYHRGKLKFIGAHGRHDTAIKETTTVRTGSNAIVIVGPGDHDFNLAVDAVSTTVSVYMRYDTLHGTTNKPQMKIINGEECGVSEATATMTSGIDTWEQISLNFTPARAGIITIRLLSRSAVGNGKAFADDFLVSVTG